LKDIAVQIRIQLVVIQHCSSFQPQFILGGLEDHTQATDYADHPVLPNVSVCTSVCIGHIAKEELISYKWNNKL